MGLPVPPFATDLFGPDAVIMKGNAIAETASDGPLIQRRIFSNSDGLPPCPCP